MSSAKILEMISDPISLDIMKDPCITECHHTFERSMLLSVFKNSPTTKCPLCNTVISVNKLGTNYALKSIIDSLDSTETKKCFVCGDLNHMANQCTNRTCRKCNKTGHIANQCTESNVNNKCYNCNELGHHKDKCPKNVVNTTSIMKCYNCNELGHHKNQCPKNVVNTTSIMKCYNCNELGHHKNKCPKNTTNTVSDTYIGIEYYNRNELGHLNTTSIMECYNCGNSGHHKDRCPETNTKKIKNIMNNICNKCGNMGHQYNACPNNINKKMTPDEIYNLTKNLNNEDLEILGFKNSEPDESFRLNDDDNDSLFEFNGF